MLTIQQLNKKYGSKTVLQGIDWQLEAGRVYGLVGVNGAGKTTLFRCIAGLESFGGSLNSPLQPLKNHLGWLPTHPIFMSRLTGAEYLRLCCIARQVPVPDLKAHNLFELPLNEYAEQYSTGMKKKLALMGVLLQQNQLYLLDEPFNGLDIQSNTVLLDIIHTLRDKGKTVVLASHIFSTLKDSCDQIALLENGQLTQQVPPSEYDALSEQLRLATRPQNIDQLSSAW